MKAGARIDAWLLCSPCMCHLITVNSTFHQPGSVPPQMLPFSGQVGDVQRMA